MRRFAKLVPLILSLACLGITVFSFLHWQNIFDWWQLRNYQPSARVSSLAQNTTMTPKARRLFYVYKPALDNKSDFAGHCQSYEKSIVLGCYKPTSGIYIYNVPDKRLNGIHEVTAAHELLHAAYDRLSRSERQRIDALTANVFANLNDERIKQSVASYREHDPAVVPNELHSILGTEVRALPPALEQYYSQYFSDRSKVVSYSETYEAIFTERKQKVAEIDNRLVSLRAEITASERHLTAQETYLASERQRLDNLLAAKQYAAYNAATESFNSQVKAYNALISVTESQIDQYNMLAQERNAIAVEEQELIKALDSRIQTQNPE